MEIDDVTAVWRTNDARLDKLAKTNVLLVRRSSLVKTQTIFDRLRRTVLLEVLINVVVVLLLGAFAAHYARELPVFLASVALDVYALAFLASTFAQLVALAQIDFNEPVIAIAQKVERLKLLRARTAMYTLTLAPLMWPALAIAGARGLLHVEPIATLGLPWILANLAFGAAVLWAVLWFARRYGRRARTASWFRRLSDSMSGEYVRAATEQLDGLLRYEKEHASAA